MMLADLWIVLFFFFFILSMIQWYLLLATVWMDGCIGAIATEDVVTFIFMVEC